MYKIRIGRDKRSSNSVTHWYLTNISNEEPYLGGYKYMAKNS
jgi:hypothetical protein